MRMQIVQLLTYLKLTGYTLGFPVNFNVTLIKDGMKRIIRSAKTDSLEVELD